MLERFLEREEFSSYEDFLANYELKVPENFNFAFDVIDIWSQEEPDKEALVWCNDYGDEKRFSFSEIADLSARAAALLADLGIKKGDTVLLLLKRRWQFWILAPALMRLGAIFIPATVQLTKKDLLYRLEAASVHSVITITEAPIVEALKAAAEEYPALKNIAFLTSEAGQRLQEEVVPTPKNWVDFNQRLEQTSKAQGEIWLKRPAVAGGEDPMLLYFTSGTTGMPKMVLHNYNHPLGHIVTARYWQQLRSDDLHISVADTGWAKCGWGKIYGQWICGAANFVYDMERFDPRGLLEKLAHYRVTTFCAPPTIYRFMIQEKLSDFDLSHLRLALTAGEPLNPEVFNRFKAETGLEILEGFGQTEGSVLCASFPWFPPRPGSMGKPAPLYKLDIVDDDNCSCPAGTEGRVVVTGLDQGSIPGLFCGYYRDEKTTLSVWHDGIYETGDVAWKDEEGYFWYVGRNDDVIKCSGYRIGPFEVESALQEHPAVLECAVTAVPDAVRGQIVKASIILTKNFEPSEDLVKALQEHVKKTTAPYKYPRIIEFVDVLPKTISGKIRRVEIRSFDEKGQV